MLISLVFSKVAGNFDDEVMVLGVVNKGLDVVSKILDLVNNAESSANEEKYNQIQKDLDRITESQMNFFITYKLDRITDTRNKIELAKGDLARYINQTILTRSATSTSALSTKQIFIRSAGDARSGIQGLPNELLGKIHGMGDTDVVQLVTDQARCNLFEFNKKTASLKELLQDGIIVEVMYLELQSQSTAGEKTKWVNELGRVEQRISELEMSCENTIKQCTSHFPALVPNPILCAAIVVMYRLG